MLIVSLTGCTRRYISDILLNILNVLRHYTYWSVLIITWFIINPTQDILVWDRNMFCCKEWHVGVSAEHEEKRGEGKQVNDGTRAIDIWMKIELI